MATATQQKMREITKELDGGEFTDLQLVERILRLRAEKGQAADALKQSTQELAERLQARGVTEATIGERLIVIGPKLLTEYDQGTLKSLEPCCTADQVWLTIRSVPSGKQLRALSDLAGAPAKAVIASAKRKIETDTLVVRIKKPKQPKQPRNGRGRRG